MALRYWVGGSGSWSDTTKWATTSGGTGGASTPILTDDVIIDGNSGSPVILLAVDRSCLTLTTTGATCTINDTSDNTLSVYGNITLSSTTTIDNNVSISMRATGTITLNNAVFTSSFTTSLSFNGSGATFTLGSNINIPNRNITLTAGTLTTSASNYSITARAFNSNGTSTRTINFNSSTINLTDNFNLGDGTGLTATLNNSTINISGTLSTFAGAGQTFKTVVINGATAYLLTGQNTFTTLTLTATSDIVWVDANQTITGTLTVSGEGTANRIRLISSQTSVRRTITAGTTTLTRADFGSIAAAGTGSWTGTSIGNIGNNTGISGYAAAVTRYAVVNNSSDDFNFTTIGWATSSGGTTGASVPLPQDTVYFDGNSLGAFYAYDLFCSTLICTGFSSGTLYLNRAYFLGNVTLPAKITNPGAGEGDGAVFLMGTGTHTVTFNNTEFDDTLSIGSIYIDNVGSYSFNGNVTITGASWSFGVPYAIEHYSGTFSAGSGTLNVSDFYSDFANKNYTRTMNMDSCTWVMVGTDAIWSIQNTGTLTFNKGTAVISINPESTPTTFNGAGLSYPTLSIDGAGNGLVVNINGSNSFDTITSTHTANYTLNFAAGTTTQIGTFSAKGTSSSNKATIKSSSTSTRATLVKTSPWNVGVNSTSSNSSNINLVPGDGIDWLIFQYINAFPGPSSFLWLF